MEIFTNRLNITKLKKKKKMNSMPTSRAYQTNQQKKGYEAAAIATALKFPISADEWEKNINILRLLFLK